MNAPRAACARAAGLEVINQNGFFTALSPELGLELHASTLAAAKDRAIQSGTTTPAGGDELVSELRAASRAPDDWVSTPIYLDLALQKQLAAQADG